MAISFNQAEVAPLNNQQNRTLPTDRQQSAAPVLTQTSQASAQNQQTQALTVRPVPAPGSNNATNRTTDPKDDDTRQQAFSVNSDSQLSEGEKQQVQKLRARDRQVRTHEQAHLSAAGGLANGGPTFTTQRGPDGQHYAVGGEVSINTSNTSNDPEQAIAQAQQIRRAALAPADPSAQDLAVAAQATVQEQQARAELSEQRTEELRESSENDEAESEIVETQASSTDAATSGGEVATTGETDTATQNAKPENNSSGNRSLDLYRAIEQSPAEPAAASASLDIFA
jgi:hypothetical protein